MALIVRGDAMSSFHSLMLTIAAIGAPAHAAAPAPDGHFMFVWGGDRAKQGNDFLMVIDADPASPTYGKLVTSVGTDQRTVRPHHTEYVMPASGMLFANDHDAGRTFIMDVRDPLQPKVATSFTTMAGFGHPHSYLRLPNGNVLATFQHVDHAGGHAGHMQATGFGKSGVTYQLWRLSDLKLLTTAFFDPGDNRYGHISPEEPRRGPDGSVLVQTLSCGIQRITGIATATPTATLVHTFPGNFCGVPTITSHYLIQSVPAIHGLIVLDIADPQRPKEVSRITLGARYDAHWTGWDAKAKRLVVTSGRDPEDRLFLLKLDEATGAIAVDERFRDVDGKPGFSFAARAWPHNWTGSVTPHGAVFSR